MKISRRSLLAASAALMSRRPAAAQVAGSARSQVSAPAGRYPVQPVPFTAVHIEDAFWTPRIETNRKVTIPFAFQKCEETGRVANFVRAAAVMHGDTSDRTLPGYPFDDTDVYKVIEGASYTLSVQYDRKLDAYVDSLIVKIAAAQEPDGYLYTARTINPEHPHKWAGKERWVSEEVLSHELYNLGHLYEAATAHYQATGKRSLLDISIKTANLLCNTFGPGKRAIYPGHQIVEMGLVKLYGVTGDGRYLVLAKFMLDSRGPGGDSYNQANLRVVDQREAVGHAVRATYMYSGMADVAAMTGDTAYVTAIDAIWENVVSKKLYLTGGIGSRKEGEAFGDNFELPNLTAYNETCAAVGNDFWNHRLFLLHADAKYIDVMERTLYNGLISGVSLDGKSFFYPNPLESVGGYERSPWFGVACCPGNITRFMASVPGYMYAHQGDTVYVNLYAAGQARIKTSDRSITIHQNTRYPWDGNVKLTIEPESPGHFSINLRIPGWAREQVVPSKLYRFADASSETPSLKVNGHSMQMALEKGYVRLNRRWKSGDVIELELPMPVRRVLAAEEVEADRGRVALQRGPIVYCTESP
ncbi:MAG: glycoside hydrolase family 127 protein, partial [Acidobacteriaceae bacterium]|nr:glycoside hydrolase family 127 protein [Acidobacteriaceae bacterium]